MRELIACFPAYYLASPEMRDLQAAMQPEITALQEYQEDVIDQLCVETATWGLSSWEKALGIPIDESKALDFRRSRIRAKLRGNGVTTVAMIQSVAESYSNGSVFVTEYPEQYRLEIKFVGTLGIPPNMDDLTQTLRDILPAHLEWAYVFVFNTWAAAGALTWGQAKAFTWKQLRESDLNG